MVRTYCHQREVVTGFAAYLKHGGWWSLRSNVLIRWAHLDGLPGRLVNNGARAERFAQGDYDAIGTVVGVATEPTSAGDLDTHLGVGLQHLGRGVLVA